MKKILFAASECVPFIKTGGLADVCGALPKEFDKEEWDVRVVIPNYSCIPEKYRSQFEYVTHFYMSAGTYIQDKYVGVLQYVLDGITYYFIDNQEYFNCIVPYGDIRFDIEKFCFFDKAVLSILKQINFRPDLIHCHDWETGLIPVYLKNEFQADSFYWRICLRRISWSSRRTPPCSRVDWCMRITSRPSAIPMRMRFRRSITGKG